MVSTLFHNSRQLILPLKKLSYPFTVLLLLLEIIRHKFTGRSSNANLIKTFLLYGGLPATLLSRLIGGRSKSFQDMNSSSVIREDLNIDKKTLRRLGYSLAPQAISQNVVAELLELSLRTPGENRIMDSGHGQESGVFFNRLKPNTVRFDVDSQKLLQNSLVQEFICDPTILSIAQDYLGSAPVFDFIAMWWHTQSNTPDKEAAQYFHFDMDRLRWIKFFFYVTDVNADSGPHVFVPESHRDFGLPFKLRKKGFTRLTDNEVALSFPASTWQTFTGSAGSMIVEDTRGLHKGKHVIAGDRLVFQLQYSTSTFGYNATPYSIKSSSLSPALKSSIDHYPKVFPTISIV